MGSIELPLSEPREFTPDLYPPFPEETQPCADLQTLSLADIQAGIESERSRLLTVCKDQGFFYLDVSNTNSQCLLRDAEALAHLSEDVFSLPLAEKMEHFWGQKPYSLLGYKPAGYAKADQYGTKRDTTEFMNCGKDDVLETPGRFPVHLPALLTTTTNRSLLAQFAVEAQHTGVLLLSALSSQLGLSADTFDEMHRMDRPSDSQVRLTRAPPRISNEDIEIANPGHTDFGTITLLFNWLGGLQIWSESHHGGVYDNSIGSDLGPESGRHGGQWLWIKPKPGHVIVNLGDLAVKHTGGILCSGRHRVLPAPGEQGRFRRHSVVYFLRPADDHIPRRFTGGVIPPLKDGEVEELLTSTQWAARQLKQLKDGKAKTNPEP